MNFDPGTLLLVAAFILFLLGGLMFLAAFQGRQEPTLWWVGASMWLSCSAFLLGITRQHPEYLAFSIIVTNTLLILSHACLWTGLRLFRGHKVLWPVLLAGPAIWPVLGLWPVFMQEVDLRVAVYSVLCLVYLLAAIREIWPEWREHQSAISPLLGFLVLHALFYAYRIPPRTFQDHVWANWPEFALVMFEGIFFVVGLSYSVLMAVRARAEDNYRYAALHDVLTTLPNRRALFHQGAVLLQEASAHHADIAALMCDLDHFKLINDRFGHETGDQVLIRFARVLREVVGDEGFYARLGGEEFVVLVPHTGRLGAEQWAQKIRSGLAACSEQLPSPLTVSVGIACASDMPVSLDRLLAQADRALYLAKAAGRDCIRVWP
ncbi:GGDEF domain-containing protein [Castellaniella sp.]|uniref:GGDEF domain-containing protein n=1 Tax=Castellaniella sp. TaxID=1955812 RepID=UPI003A93AF93